MKLTIYTMKYRNKNYIGLGMLPVLMMPVIATTIGLTLLISNSINNRSVNLYQPPATDLIARQETMLEDTPEFKVGDQALFNFTGDTVLVVTQPEDLAELDEEVRVLHKNASGNFETIDLPENWLVKIMNDTTASQNPR